MSNPWDDPLQNLNDDDIPSDMEDGWRINRRRHPRYNVAPGDRSADDVYTRRTGYEPYQSVVHNDGRHAYDPHSHQYPQSNDVGYAHTALDPTARRREFMQNRFNYFVHLPGERVNMGIDENQMRTQPMPAAAFPPHNVQPAQQQIQQIQQQPIQQQPIQQQPIQQQPIQQRHVQRPIPPPVPQHMQQPVRGRPLLPQPAPVQGPMRGPVRSPMPGHVRAPMPGPVRAPVPGPVRAPMPGPVRAPIQGAPGGALGARGGMPPLPQPAPRGRGAGSMPRPARGGCGNARGNRGGRR